MNSADRYTDKWSYWVPDNGESEEDVQPHDLVWSQWNDSLGKYVVGSRCFAYPDSVAEAIVNDRHSDWDYPKEINIMVRHDPSGETWLVHVTAEPAVKFHARIVKEEAE